MPKRILIVEDEEPIARLIEMNLRVANMDTVVFLDGDEAFSSLPFDHSYDLALLDIMIPGKDGFEILAALKPYNIPVIFLTAKDGLSFKVQGLKSGAEDYIVKPFEMLELLVRIDKVLERTKITDDTLKLGDVEIHPAERKVFKGKNEVVLKPMEFDLLVILAKNKNMAISRESLINLVWGTNYLGETRTVDVHIGQIRKKLGLNEALKTVPKIGYRLEDTK